MSDTDAYEGEDVPALRGLTMGEEQLAAAFSRIERRGKANPPLDTGMPGLDELIGGLWPGHLIVVGGSPASGKTSLVLGLARHAAGVRKRTTLIFTLEATAAETMDRLLSAESGVRLDRVRDGALTPGDWHRLSTCVPVIQDAPLTIVDDPALSIESLAIQCREIAETESLGLVVVDYLQLLASPASAGQNRENQVTAVAQDLKRLAKELDVPVVCVSPLNRGPQHRVDLRPQLSDLRESGAIEAAADVVVLVNRPELHGDDERAGEVDLILAKHRYRRAGADVLAAFQAHVSRIIKLEL